ncbi:MAG: hypothetical protein OEO83_08730, partial [Alphaproteobacteria bacterium]|nr:hypothetical protein [Alphaproteobacteria bacterium]
MADQEYTGVNMATEERGNGGDQRADNARRPGEEELDLARPAAERPERDKWEDDPTEAAVSEEQLSNPNIHYGSRAEAGVNADGPRSTGAPSAGGRPPLSDHAHIPESEPLHQGRSGGTGGSEGSVASSQAPEAGSEVAGNGFRAVGHGRAALRSRETEDTVDAQPGAGTFAGNGLGVPSAAAVTDDDGVRTEDDRPAPPVADPAIVGTADVAGAEDTAIALDLSAALADTDGSDTLSVTISGVPEGASLNHGIDQGGGVWSVDPGDLGDLTVTPPADSDADFTLTLHATTTESSETHTISESFTVTVDPVADEAILDAADVTGAEDTAIALDLSAALADTDGSESLLVTISGVPEGASLNHGTDQGGGVWSVDAGDLADLTVTPPADSDADFTLTLNATSTDGSDTATVSESFTVTVDAVADAADISAADVTGDENSAIALDLSAALTDADGSE